MRKPFYNTIVPIILSLACYKAEVSTEQQVLNEPATNPEFSEKNFQRFQEEIGDDNPFADIRFVLHHNGEPLACGQSSDTVDNMAAFYNALSIFRHSPVTLHKYEVDVLLTTAVAYYLITWSECSPHEEHEEDDEEKPESPLFLDYCYMGEEYTPKLPDHPNVIPLAKMNGDISYPCHFHTREGLRITSMKQLADYAREIKEKAKDEEKNCVADDDDNAEQTCSSSATLTSPELHLYAVPLGRLFIFAPSYVGETFDLSHITTPVGSPISLHVMALKPRIFEISNFYTRDEAEDVIKSILQEQSDTHKMQRSGTGATGHHINEKRTSENGFDVASAASLSLKRRGLEVLGFDEYYESFTDGLQVLRYNQSQAYITHDDYLSTDDLTDEHDYQSQNVGSNRYATILLYMSDIPEGGGGETVFPSVWPLGEAQENHVELEQAMQNVRESGVTKSLFEEGSWEEEMVAYCKTRLAIKPHSSRAVLFYSQHPDGSWDPDAKHGGCPVLEGTKWAANLWVWNGPRDGQYEPRNQEAVERNRKNGINPKGQLAATFRNTGKDPKYANAELFYKDMFWGKLGHDDPPLHANTYKGHIWNMKVDGEVLQTWVVDERLQQVFEV